MERVMPQSARIQGLAAVLIPPRETSPHASDARSTVDPVEALEAERKGVLEAAREEGHAQGLAEARQQLEARVAAAERRVVELHATEVERTREARKQLQSLLETLPEAIDALEASLEAVVIECAYAAVGRILGTLDADGTLMQALCRQALADYRQRPVVVRVCPEDAELLEDIADGINVRAEGDRRFAAGQCRLETHKGVYEAGLEVRMEALKQALLQSLATAKDGGA